MENFLPMEMLMGAGLSQQLIERVKLARRMVEGNRNPAAVGLDIKRLHLIRMIGYQ